MTMSLARRLALLERARADNAWIFEDDYDSEWRYRGRPLAALQGLDRDGRVIYAGSFSKVLFASLRIGYLVVPARVVDAFLAARATLDDQPSLIAQPALAAFMADGHFAAYLRRQRRIYRARQERTLAAASKPSRGPAGRAAGSRRPASGGLSRRPSSSAAWTIAPPAGARPPPASPCRRCPNTGSAGRAARA